MNLINHYKNTTTQFGWITIIIHWLLAFVIIGLYFLGDYMMGLTYYDSFYSLAPKIHEALGVAVFLLMLFRVVWKKLNASPNPPATNSNLINKISKLAHLSLYLITFLILITGLLISFAGGQGLEIFDWFTIPGPAELFENQATLAGEVHRLTALALMALVALHTLAALKHHLIDKDTTLKNMLGVKEK